MESKWNKSKVPIDRYTICVSSHSQNIAEWVFVGKGNPKFEDSADTKFRIGVDWVRFWHELPESPWKEGDEWVADGEWIRCSKFPAPSYEFDSIQFLLFDEEKGIVEAEYWGGYETDVVSCKFGYKKPLFWRPFPLLPLPSYGVLQI